MRLLQDKVRIQRANASGDATLSATAAKVTRLARAQSTLTLYGVKGHTDLSDQLEDARRVLREAYPEALSQEPTQ